MKNFLYKIINFSKKIWQTTLTILQRIIHYLLPRIKPFFVGLFNFSKKYYFVLNKREKLIVLGLLLITITTSWLWWRKNYIENTKIAPDNGGTYTEGIVAQKAADIEQVINKLTKVGLVRFNNNGNLVSDLAESWTINDGGKQYVFKLRSFVKAQDLVEILKNKNSTWQNITIKAPEEHSLEFDLKQPYSPFLSSLSEPLFPYGPYIIEKESKAELRLKANNDFYLAKPHIAKIILKLYPDELSLNQGLNRKEIDGVAKSDNTHKGYNLYKMLLPRWQVVFFNLNQDIFKDKTTRQKIAKGEKLDKTLEAVLVTSNKQPYVAKAEELKNKWQALGLNIHVVTRDPLELQQITIPKRDYDLLLYGIDYGTDPDPYPFWHSSQISETNLNLANFANVDADKLLEEGRLTTDGAKRKEIYANFNKILADETPAIFLEQTTWQYLVSQKVKGVKNHSGVVPADRYNEIWKWYIKEKRVKK